jgi:hypothetical protein
MSENVFARYSKKHLLEGKQILVSVSDPPKKLAIGGKIKPLGFQRVEHENEHPRVTWLEYFVVPSEIRKCWFQHVLLHQEEYGNHPTKNE